MSPPPLRLCFYQPNGCSVESSDLEQAILLGCDRFSLQEFTTIEDLVDFLKRRDEPTDCLLLVVPLLAALVDIGERLTQHGCLLPAVVLVGKAPFEGNADSLMYHKAVITLPLPKGKAIAKLDLAAQVERAIALFLQLSPKGVRPGNGSSNLPTLMQQQQRRLSEKLRERLGYAGVFYKRSQDRFYRHLPEEERVELMARLKELYRTIVLEYFHAPDRVNSVIDEFAALAFLADISVSQVLELHMQLMDSFTKQLKLEGRSEEIVLDYRITLIDVIAHLSEMYRRSIPRSPSPKPVKRGTR